MSASLRLPRAARIRDDVSVERLRRGPRKRGQWFAVAARSSGARDSRIVIRVGKKSLRSAVERNRIRRCVREVFRHERPDRAAADYLVTLLRPYRESSLEPAREELRRLLRTAAPCASC